MNKFENIVCSDQVLEYSEADCTVFTGGLVRKHCCCLSWWLLLFLAIVSVLSLINATINNAKKIAAVPQLSIGQKSKRTQLRVLSLERKD